MIDLREVRLRSNPHFRLVPYDRLDAGDVARFESLGRDPDFFGILLAPPGSVLMHKSVSRDAALLFLALQEPGRLPRLLDALFGSVAADRLRLLILDSVFEVEVEGRFVSGAAALALLGDREPGLPASRLNRLSEDAICYAAALDLLPVQAVAARLYAYNAEPVSAALQQRFGDDAALRGFLLEDPQLALRLGSRWRSRIVGDSWIAWSRDDGPAILGYKLYVSPRLGALPGVFAAALSAFDRFDCAHFKVGRGAHGLLRPDKLVAYFPTLDRLQAVAAQVQPSCRDVAAQGVPFTAPIDADGLLSWAMDPPRFEQVLAAQQFQSWRQWLTSRIAVYAAAARQADADVLSFVRNRVALDGIDPLTWSPDLAIWRGPAGTEREVM
jgi:hypothetical protein